MLTHSSADPRKPSRVVVLGANGFIGGEILRQVESDGIPSLGIGRAQVDLTKPGAAESLAALLEPSDALVFVSAKAPCKDLAMLRENLVMAEAVCTALQKLPVAHVVYISSDAVYKDSPGAIIETSCAEPGSLHGVMHLAREVAVRHAFAGPLALIRPTLVYGFDDPHNGYGPNRFRRLAAAGKNIVLFGEGEERRDHVDVQDVAALARLVLLHRSKGIANAASGEVVSFRELAEFAAGSFEPRVDVLPSPRNGPMPHNGYRPFDNSALAQAFPGLRFRGWREGLEAVNARQGEAGHGR